MNREDFQGFSRIFKDLTKLKARRYYMHDLQTPQTAAAVELNRICLI